MIATRQGAREAVEAAILSILDASARPLTAYGIQSAAAANGLNLYPNQVYRTIRRLVSAGRVRRIESANAFMKQPDGTDMVALCEGCGAAFALSLGEQRGLIVAAAAVGGFAVSRQIIEVIGLCPACTVAAGV